MNILVVYYKGFHEQILPLIRGTAVERDSLKEDIKDRDMIVVVGGDGTFLRASHHNKDVPMFGINPSPENKEGFFLQADLNDFQEKLDRIHKGFSIGKLLRLEAEINGKKLKELALNEIYIGDAKPYLVFNYQLKIGKMQEFQRSSGILIGTPAGSNAWLKSAGGITMEMHEEKYQYIVREPYIGRLTPACSLRKGIMEKVDIIEVECKSPGIVVIDSISPEYKIKAGDKLKISVSNHPLKYIKL
jgi:NAD kinase